MGAGPLLLAFLLAISSIPPCHPTLRPHHPIESKTTYGMIRGEHLRKKGTDYLIFKGIPYAAPPVGSLQFKRPEEPAKWRGTMNATQYSPLCIQKKGDLLLHPERSQAVYNEDCLYLNVFTQRETANSSLFPVVVFIHGGKFQYGGASDLSQQAILDNFVSRKMIFISMNYRLGPLGFISTGDSHIPGNVGLWDILMAIKWAKANVHEWNGDPSNIMLMGAGSGASAASLLALSPHSKGLFQKIFLMSGSALTPGAVRNSAIISTNALANALDCRPLNFSEIIGCLQVHFSIDIYNINSTLDVEYENYVPVVDGPDGLIPVHPEEALRKQGGGAIKHAMMIGTTRDESSLYIMERGINMSAIESEAAASKLAWNLSHGESETIHNKELVYQALVHEYIKSKVNPAFAETVLQQSVLEMFSHFWYDAPASRMVEYYVNRSQSVFLYSFDHISESMKDIDRAFHGVDVMWLFNMVPKFVHRSKDKNWQPDERVTEVFSDLIANFAHFGTPNNGTLTSPFNWTETDVNELNYLSITDTPRMEVGFRWQGHAFWNRYIAQIEAVDVGNMKRVEYLSNELGDYQMATWMLLFSTLFFFAILVGLACYCTRKESEEDDL